MVAYVSAATDMPVDALPASWGRACALLLRQALELSLARLWKEKAPSLIDATFRSQLICFREYTDDEALVNDVRAAWYDLSSACHHSGHGMPPSRASLKMWTARVDRLVTQLDALIS